MSALLILQAVADQAGHAGISDTVTWGNVGGAAAVITFLFGAFFKLDGRNRERSKQAADELAANNARLSKEAREANDRIIADLGKLNTGLGTRLDRVEQKCQDFMPKAEIEKEIAHAKVGASTATSLLSEVVKGHADSIVDLRVQLGKIEQKHEGLEEDVGEIKTMLKEHRQEINAKLEKMEAENAKGRAEIIASIREFRDVKPRG